MGRKKIEDVKPKDVRPTYLVSKTRPSVKPLPPPPETERPPRAPRGKGGRQASREGMRLCSAWITPEHMRAIGILAAEQERTKQDLVRSALNWLMESNHMPTFKYEDDAD